MIYAMYFALLVSSICTFAITKAFNNKKTILLNSDYDLSRRSVSSALNYCLMTPGIPLNTINNKVFLENKEVAFIKRKWGVFDQIISQALTKNQPVTIGGFYGNKFNNKICLYLAEQNTSLSVSGQTIIKGDVLLPKKKVSRAFVEGKNFTGDKMINGGIKPSNKNLPEFGKENIDEIKRKLNGIFDFNNDSITPYYTKDSVYNSFSNKTLVFKSNSSLYLSKCDFSGNIIFYNKNKITIDSTCNLENVIFFSSKIIIKEGVKGSFQAFASDSLIIDKNTTLTYPSSIGVVGDKLSYLKLDSNSVIEGSIVHLSVDKKSTTFIHKDATVKGIVYNDNQLILKGTVLGKVTANKFYLKTASTRYNNLLLDATIDISEVPEFMSYMTDDDKKKKILIKTVF